MRRLKTDYELISEMWDRTIVDGNCWRYIGTYAGSSRNYGQISLGRRHYKELVHRVSARIFLGLNVNSVMQANHKLECRFQNCWNPDHLYVGTAKQNSQDIIFAGRSFNKNKTHCKNGHEFNLANTRIRKIIKVSGSIRTETLRRLCIQCQKNVNNRSYHNKNRNKENV